MPLGSDLSTLTWSRRSWVRGLGLGVAVTSLAGCANRPPPTASATALAGRMILQIGATPSQPARQWSAGFELRGTARAGELDLTSPLGTVVAQARWQPGMVELSQGAERLRFDSLPDLARQLLGETVPLEALFDWLRGRPEPQAPHEVTAAGFLQQGWDIDLTGLAAGTFTAKRSSEPTITLRARLEGAP